MVTKKEIQLVIAELINRVGIIFAGLKELNERVKVLEDKVSPPEPSETPQ